MDLENMKALWQQYDKTLQANSIINQRIMKSMLAEKSSSKIGNFMNMEYLSLSIASIVLLVFISMIHKVGRELQMVLPYIMSIVLLTSTIAWNIYKLRLLNNIDTYSDSVVNTREKVERMNLLFAKEKIWSILLMPVLIFCLAPVLHHWLYGTYFFDQIGLYLPRIIVGYLLGIAVTYRIYKTLYSKNIQIILGNLKEIESLKGKS